MAQPARFALNGDRQSGDRGFTPVEPDAGTGSTILSRRRTKTGCLTCRKRRIKCDEAKPSCRSCVKSKRHCEGYAQRVVFKTPAYGHQLVPDGGAHVTYQAGPEAGPAMMYQSPLPNFGDDPSMYAIMPTRPLEHFVPGHFQRLEFQLDYQPLQQYVQSNQPVAAAQSESLPPETSVGVNYARAHTLPSASLEGRYYPSARGQEKQLVYPSSQAIQGADLTVRDGPYTPSDGLLDSLSLQNSHTWASANPVVAISQQATSQPPLQTLPRSESSMSEASKQLWPSEGYLPRPELLRPIDYQNPRSATSQPQAATYSTPEYYEHELHTDPLLTPDLILTQGAIEACDDDYYDVESGDEIDAEQFTIVTGGDKQHQALGRILELNNISVKDLQTRRYDTFIHNGMLDNYHAEHVANPLKNAATARVFAHFIAVTGPSLSIFERHPRNTSVLFTEGHIPFSQQGLWTYTMPMAALHNQGLLHAMLAIASLHIARMTGASATPSLQHYVWATKRVHPDVGHPKKRLRVATIGASMLLGFYEIMTADHIRWNTHLAGSSKLFVETPFAEMTRQFRRMKQDRRAETAAQARSGFDVEPRPEDEILEQVDDVDERVVSHFAGKEVRYGDHGHVETGNFGTRQLDLPTFETLKDLYWWYCKQDVYQTILSGNDLLMEFSRWANCPPRAPLGKPDAVYGSFDHLILLLARVADFAARDRPRKLRQIKANGGHWIPVKGMTNAPPPRTASMNDAQPGISASGPQAAPPMFYGMAPPLREQVRMPSSYGQFSSTSVPQSASTHDHIDLQVATSSALEEYGRIRAALHNFSISLGDYYQPLQQEFQPPLDTPFGTAKFYRAYDINCLWAVYNMAVIIAIRSQPHMPPAAHMAAAIAKQETAFFANEIGRIVAGIVSGPEDQPLNPSLGAALCESCMPSFFAAVQYEETAQRHTTVMRIFSIAQRTGWGSAELIANGCETAWVKGAARGGPPYERVVRPQQSTDPRLNGSWERLDPRQMPHEGDQWDRRLVHRRADARVNWAIGVMGTEEDLAMTG